MAKNPKRPRDPNQLAKLITDLAIGDVVDKDPNEGKDPAAISRGRSGGMKGGKARADKLTAEKRKEIAIKAAKKRRDKPKIHFLMTFIYNGGMTMTMTKVAPLSIANTFIDKYGRQAGIQH